MNTIFPYPLLSGNEVKVLMNEFSSRGEPFYVLVSFDASKGYFIPRADLDEEWVRFAFHAESSSARSSLTHWEVSPVSMETYGERFERVMWHLHRGNSFLVNLTQPSCVNSSLNLEELFNIAVAPYKVWMRDQLVCFSPESFIRIDKGVIRTFPMKGTIDAAVPDAERILLENEKEKAEHATIVDLLRNDLSMVASEVDVCRYRYIDRIRTHKGELLQVSSEIKGILADDYRSKLGDVLFALLPAGSICGAPKQRTVAIIRETEGYDRGFYTGICGVFDGQALDTAVMIRFVEQTPDGLVFKSGGGITSRSDKQQEYQELIQKVYVPLH